MESLKQLRARLTRETRDVKFVDRYVGVKEEECGDRFLDAADEEVICHLPKGHQGRHNDRGFPWGPIPRGSLPTDGNTDGKSDPGSGEKGTAMAKALRDRKIEEDKTMKKQDPMECVKRALGVEK